MYRLGIQRLRLWAGALAWATSIGVAQPARAQTFDVALSSMVGGSLGGLGGIVLSLPKACGGAFSDQRCDLPIVAERFAALNLLGSAFGGASAARSSSCSYAQRFSRSLAGTIAGAALGVGLVSYAHGNLRIGLTPLVQVGEGVGAAALLKPCSAPPVAPDSGSNDLGACQSRSPGIARAATGLALAGGYGGLYLYFHQAWWSGAPAKVWFVQNDWDQLERDADKFGHFFGGFHLARGTTELLETGCMTPSRAALWGAIYAYAFQFQIEEWDGTQVLYGFNPSDLLADAAGALLSVAQQRVKPLQAIKPVFSYRPTLAYRRRNAPGHAGQPRATTDYSGQTYWFSTDVHALLPDRAKPFWPPFIRFAPGVSITDYVDPVSGRGIRARRRVFLSLDLDLEHLPGNGGAWRAVKHELSFLRIPGPTLQLTPGLKFVGARY